MSSKPAGNVRDGENAGTRHEAVDFPWFHFVALSSDDAAEWVKEYRCQQYFQIGTASFRVVQLLRQHQPEESRKLLRTIECWLNDASPASPSIFHVCERWYHAARAYYCYCEHDLDGAERHIASAEQAVKRAIELHLFLVPLATEEFCLTRAQIERSRRRWDGMRAYIERAREMVENRAPFCVLSDGTGISHSTLREFLLSIHALTTEEKQAVRELLDEKRRIAAFDHLVARLYILPGHAIYLPAV